MVIGERLRALREQKGLSLGDIEKRSGLRRPYISRVDHGPTVPTIGRPERMAGAPDVPLHEVFHERKARPKPVHLSECQQAETVWGRTGKGARVLSKFRRLLASLGKWDRRLLIYVAQKMARHKQARSRSSRPVAEE